MDLEGFDLGGFGRPASTSSAVAQEWFDRGLAWTYGFNHVAAVRCFEEAIRHDERFALAHWGVALAAGPNYNRDWDAFEGAELAAMVRLTHDASARAAELAADATPVEQALTRALCARYPAPEPPEDLAAWSAAYAEAMTAVGERFGDDLDVAALTADALMMLTPWQLWDVATGEPAAGARTLEARATLERALAAPGGAHHLGVLHLWIHLIEMSAHPEHALPAADTLRTLVPDAGHLIHMGTHIDVLSGDYQRVMADNARAAGADERYLAVAAPTDFYVLYHAHDLHFLIYGAMFAGHRAGALAAADRLAAALPESVLRAGMADDLEAFVGMGLHALIRFGEWDALLATELPSDPELYCVTTALTHYARGVAAAATGDVARAETERDGFRAAVERVPESRYLFNNTALDILAVAGAMLDGELDYRRGAVDTAFGHLRRAIELDDTLPYDEPWGWMQPTRHAYGALLLEQGEVQQAEAVYAADLGLDDTLGRACQHPNNVWSLHGYHECLTRLGKAGEARIVGRQLDLALARADVEIRSSCFCRGAAQAA